MLQVKAIRIEQRGQSAEQGPTTLFVTALPAGELLSRARVDAWSEGNPEGYQRPLNEARLRDVEHYLRQEEGVFPTSILLAIREKDVERTKFMPEGKVDGAGEWGTLVIPEGVTLWVVDGQHRLFGLERTLTATGDDWLRAYPLAVTIVHGVDAFREMRHFYIINTRQKGVETDIVDQHILRMRRELGADMMPMVGRRLTRQQKEYLRAIAVEVVHLLNQLDSPWRGAIALPGQKMLGKRQRFHAVVASLEPVLRDHYLAMLAPKDLARLLANYWSALSNVWPEAFGDPDNYRVQETPGLYSLHIVFPDIVARCRERGDFSVATMADIVRATGIDSMFWHKVNGHRLTVGTGMGSIRLLAHYIRERLPRLTLPGLG